MTYRTDAAASQFGTWQHARKDRSTIASPPLLYTMLASIVLLGIAACGAFAAPGRGHSKLPGHFPQDCFTDTNHVCVATESVTNTETSTLSSIVSPPPATTTISVFQTENKTVILHVFSTTATVFITTTTTQTTTSTQTEASTVSNFIQPPISIVPIPAWFTPIRFVGQFGGPYPTNTEAPWRKRDLGLEDPGRGRLHAIGHYDPKPGNSSFPATVSTAATRQLTTHVNGAVEALQKTSTFIATLNVHQEDPSTTITFTKTVNVERTVTSTARRTISITTTVDVPSGPTPLSYAACGPDNLLGKYNEFSEHRIDSIAMSGAMFLGKQSSALECCVACLNTPNCAGSSWNFPNCVGMKPAGICNGSIPAGNFTAYYHAFGRLGPGIVLSNGKCGQWRLTGAHKPGPSAHFPLYPEPPGGPL